MSRERGTVDGGNSASTNESISSISSISLVRPVLPTIHLPVALSGLRIQASAIDPVVLLHLRDDLRIGQLVRGLDSDKTVKQRLGSAETLLELQLGLPRPEDKKSLGLPQLSDDLVELPVKMLAVAVLVFLLASAVLRA